MTRVLSCIQPTGAVHLGNYLGALRNWVDGQHDKDVFHGIVDLHALTVTETPGVVGEATLEVHHNAHQGKVGVLCLAPEAGLGVSDPEKRAALLPKITRFADA